MIDKTKYQDMSTKKLNNELLTACERGKLEIVKYLLTSPDLKEHANIYYKNKSGLTVLMYACKFNNLEVIKYLLIDMNMNVDEDTINWIQNNYNDTETYENFLKILNSKILYDKLNKKIDNSDNEIIIKRVKL